MPDLAIHPPIHVTTHPDEPIRSVSAAAKFVRRHAGEQPDPPTLELLAVLEGASSAEAAACCRTCICGMGAGPQAVACHAGPDDTLTPVTTWRSFSEHPCYRAILLRPGGGYGGWRPGRNANEFRGLRRGPVRRGRQPHRDGTKSQRGSWL